MTVKKTNKLQTVSKLRKKEVKTIGGFKFDNIECRFYHPYFEEDKKGNIKVSSDFISGGAEITLTEKNTKLIDMFSKEILINEIQSQNDEWKDIRNTVVLSAAQPVIKREWMKPNFTQERWNEILKEVETNNKELIDAEIEKILTIKL